MEIFATIFVPLSGRKKCWDKLSYFLSNQNIDKKKFNLFLMDTSDSESFHLIVQKWIKNCQYKKVSLIKKKFNENNNLANLDRTLCFQEVNNVMCKIYNFAKTIIEGELLFIVEDDIVPPLNAFNDLYKIINKDILCVSGAYKIRSDNLGVKSKKWVVWRDFFLKPVTKIGKKLEVVKACGFGCLLIWKDYFIESDISWSNGSRGYDIQFFSKQIKKVIINWDVVCLHFNEYEIQPVIKM